MSQVEDFGVAGQDLGEHNENVADVRVVSRLQAVDRSLDGEEKADAVVRKCTRITA